DGKQYWIKGGKRYYVGAPVISACIQGRTASGGPVQTTNEQINGYADAGRSAWCPYPEGDFVKTVGSPDIWIVHDDGTRQHVTCIPSNDPVDVVPAGEPDGHTITGN